jgi:Rad3-related DNA helicase
LRLDHVTRRIVNPHGHDGIEPAKHLLKKYLAPARLAVLASAALSPLGSHQELHLTSFRGISQSKGSFAQPNQECKNQPLRRSVVRSIRTSESAEKIYQKS